MSWWCMWIGVFFKVVWQCDTGVFQSDVLDNCVCLQPEVHNSPFIKSSNDFTYCVEGLVSWHLMSEYEVGEHTGGAPGHPHLAVHQHLACGRRCHFIFDFEKGTHPLQPGPRLWTGRPLENAEKCFAGAHPAVSTPCTWCRRESNKPVFSGWLNFYFEITWLVFTVPFLFPSAVLRTWVTPSRFR